MAESELGDIRYPCAKLQLGRNSRKIIATLARCIFFFAFFSTCCMIVENRSLYFQTLV